MSINTLSDQEKNILLQLSYIDLPKGLPKNISLTDLAEKIEIHYKGTDDERVTNFTTFMNENKDSKLQNFTLKGYENNNYGSGNNVSDDSKTGFVGYAFEDKESNSGITLFRGSEMSGINNTIADWGIDGNLGATLGIEITQQKQALEFFKKYMSDVESKIILGHSKGGNLATHVLTEMIDDKNIIAEVLNAQPIYWLGLTDEQKELLKSDRYNYVVTVGDIVSYLGLPNGVVDKFVAMEGFSLNPFAPHYEYRASINSNGCYDEVNPILAKIFQNSGLPGIFNKLVWKLNNTVNIISKIWTVVIEGGYRIVTNILNGTIKVVENIKNSCINFIDKLAGEIKEISSLVKNYFGDLISNTIAKLKAKNLTASKVQNASTRILVDIQGLNSYESQLRQIRTKIINVNNRIDNLYFKVGLLGIDNILRADILTSGTNKINKVISSLQNTRTLLENNEKILKIKAQKM